MVNRSRGSVKIVFSPLISTCLCLTHRKTNTHRRPSSLLHTHIHTHSNAPWQQASFVLCVYMQKQWAEKLYSLQGPCTSHGQCDLYQISLFAKRSDFFLLQLVSVLSASVMPDVLSPPSSSFIHSFSSSYFPAPYTLHLRFLSLSLRIQFRFLWGLEHYVSADCLNVSSAYFTSLVTVWLTEWIYLL